ncbi:hypothetical protein [Lichenihabitans psoromatis]|uniref:hypothetical protein n=1 Tax=Lichenihabitans psoromatis TaxID=2528642 RepID=UPI0010358976|nr:hypothetical protein [Lichenihabitans psoromatis]
MKQLITRDTAQFAINLIVYIEDLLDMRNILYIKKGTDEVWLDVDKFKRIAFSCNAFYQAFSKEYPGDSEPSEPEKNLGAKDHKRSAR